MPRLRNLQWPHLGFKFDVSKNLTLVYATRAMRELVMKLATFFLPIFLYQQGSSHDFWQFLPGNPLQRGVLLLALFYLTHRFFTVISAIILGQLTNRIGFQKSLLLSFVLLGFFLSLLYAREDPGWLIFVAAMISGLETNLFWNSHNTLVSKLTINKHLGQDLGLLQFLLQLAQAVAPALSGFLVVAFGFSVLFRVGLIGVLICVILALQIELKVRYDEVSWIEFWAWLQEKSFLRLAVSQAGRYLNSASLTFWPLYVFLLLGSIDKVGLLYSLSLFLAMIISFAVGFYIDHQKDKKPFYVSGGLLSVLWLLRSQVVSFWQVVMIDTFDRLTSSFYTLFADSILFKRGRGGQAFSYFVYREILISCTAVIFWLLVAALFLILESAWLALFVLGAVGVLLGLLVQEHHG